MHIFVPRVFAEWASKGERVCSGSTALQSVPTRSVIIAGSLAFGATAGIAWRKKFKSKKRLRLPKLPVQLGKDADHSWTGPTVVIFLCEKR